MYVIFLMTFFCHLCNGSNLDSQLIKHKFSSAIAHDEIKQKKVRAIEIDSATPSSPLPHTPHFIDEYFLPLRCDSYNQYMQLADYLELSNTFDFACERIYELATHNVVQKINIEFLYKLTRLLTQPEMLEKQSTQVLNALYRFANELTMFESISNHQLANPLLLQTVMDDSDRETLRQTCALYRFIDDRSFNRFVKQKIKEMLIECTQRVPLQKAVRSLNYEIAQQSAPLDLITVVGSKDTIGDGINAYTMDYFDGIQYPWLSYILPALQSKFTHVEVVAWDNPTINWHEKQYLIMGPLWGYTRSIESFKGWLQNLRALKIPSLNGPNFMLWNLNKTYLKSFPATITLPTTYVLPTRDVDLQSLFDIYKSTQLVIKGIIDAGGFNLKKFDTAEIISAQEHISYLKIHNDGALIQPYVDMKNGEISLVFTGHTMSHGFLKVPAEDDFRSQSFYGAHTYMLPIHGTNHIPILMAGKDISDYSIDSTLDNVRTQHPQCHLTQRHVLDAMRTGLKVRYLLKGILKRQGIAQPPFLRIDLVLYKGSWRLMEVEGIEPYVMTKDADIFDLSARSGVIDHIIKKHKKSNHVNMIWDWYISKASQR